MRVGLFLGAFPTASETFIWEHAVALLRRGYDLRVVASYPRGRVIHDIDLLSGSVTYRPRTNTLLQAVTGVAPLAFRATITSPLSLFRLVASYHGRSPDPLPGRDNVTMLDSIAALASGPVDIYHSHFGPLGSRLQKSLYWLNSATPTVTTFHGFDVTTRSVLERYNHYHQLLKRGSLFLAVSNSLRNRLLELGAPPARTKVHHVGIDVESFDGRGPKERNGRSFHILTIARLVEKKGVDIGLRAVLLLRNKGVPVQYSVIGDGPQRLALERFAVELGVDDVVSFHGVSARREVIQRLAEADVLLVPSVTAGDGDQEGIPVVIMEAMATYTPVVASNHSGIPEIVIDGKTGLLAEEHSAEQLSTHLMRLASEPQLGMRLAMNGRRLVETEFNSALQLEKLFAYYQQLVETA